jgi:dynein intermediate chain 4, axonemal
MASSSSTGKHSDPVWKLRWVDRGIEQQEVLVSISTDGRVTQWSTTKVSHASGRVFLQLRPCTAAHQKTGTAVSAAEEWYGHI